MQRQRKKTTKQHTRREVCFGRVEKNPVHWFALASCGCQIKQKQAQVESIEAYWWLCQMIFIAYFKWKHAAIVYIYIYILILNHKISGLKFWEEFFFSFFSFLPFFFCQEQLERDGARVKIMTDHLVNVQQAQERNSLFQHQGNQVGKKKTTDYKTYHPPSSRAHLAPPQQKDFLSHPITDWTKEPTLVSCEICLQELVNTQQLVDAKKNETTTEEHLQVWFSLPWFFVNSKLLHWHKMWLWGWVGYFAEFHNCFTWFSARP